jgi:glycolate oxidase iron-sulfur subunit
MEKMLDCVHCGFCLPTCPTYLTLGNEMDSPRGRLYLMRVAAEGRIGISDTFVKHMNLCLVCRACETACPSGVQFGNLMETARGQVTRKYAYSPAERLLRKFILEVFTDPQKMRLALTPLRAYQRLGVQRLLRGTGVLKALGRWGAMEGLMPALPAAGLNDQLPETTPPVGPRRGRAALLLGCAQRAFFPHVNLATARVLAANGYEVVAPKVQGCCGSLLVHEGEREQGKDLARQTIDTFEATGADVVVVNAAGCGSVMKEYGELLHEDAKYGARAEAFGKKVRDVSQVLAQGGLSGRLHPVPLRITYHDACHLAHGQRVRAEPRAILQAVPGLQFVELREADFCCGSAGVYNLLHPEQASEFLSRKLDRIQETGAQVVVNGNPGCTLQLAMGIRQRGLPLRAVHTVEVLDWAYRGVTA